MSSLLEKMMKAGSAKVKASVLATSDFFNDTDVVQTPIPLLNGALGGRLDSGMRSGLLMVAGESRTFKTSISLFMVGAYLKKYPDAICLFYDTEFGSTPAYFSAFGVDINRVLHIPIENLEELKFDMSQRLREVKKGDRVIVFVDSVGNIASKKEVEDAQDEKSVADMSRAKQMKSLWRIVTPMLKLRNIPCIAINHIYFTQEMYAKAVVSGGCLEAGTKILLADGNTKSIEDFVIGDMVETLQGPKEVLNVWNPETLVEGTPECFKIEFEDGTTVTCSSSHRFMIGGNWVEAKDLKVADDVVLYQKP